MSSILERYYWWMDIGRLSKTVFRSICHGVSFKRISLQSEDSCVWIWRLNQAKTHIPQSRNPLCKIQPCPRAPVTDSNWTSNPITTEAKTVAPRGLIRSGWLTDGELESKQNRNDTEPGNPRANRGSGRLGTDLGETESWWYITLTCNLSLLWGWWSGGCGGRWGGLPPRTINKDYRRFNKERLRKVVGRKDFMVLTDVKNVLDCLRDMDRLK